MGTLITIDGKFDRTGGWLIEHWRMASFRTQEQVEAAFGIGSDPPQASKSYPFLFAKSAKNVDVGRFLWDIEFRAMTVPMADQCVIVG